MSLRVALAEIAEAGGGEGWRDVRVAGVQMESGGVRAQPLRSVTAVSTSWRTTAMPLESQMATRRKRRP